MTGYTHDGDGVREVTFWVPGTPAPQGSKKYVGHRATRHGHSVPVLIESSAKVRPWRAAVAQVATLYSRGLPPIDGPVRVRVDFALHRPVSLPARIVHMIRKPDLDKLARSTLDALSGICYIDDNRVVDLHVTKAYAATNTATGALITVSEGAPQ